MKLTIIIESVLQMFSYQELFEIIKLIKKELTARYKRESVFTEAPDLNLHYYEDIRLVKDMLEKLECIDVK